MMRGCAGPGQPTPRSLLTSIGNDTVIERGHNHSLQLSVLFWSIFGRRELLLLMRTRL